mmetsp:Transcript_86839/g.246185  ORF Transcript_86839/g.246185 Transcript_86839/m.246185 type:complete len:131 (-) Transcript_86839:265-657(-)
MQHHFEHAILRVNIPYDHILTESQYFFDMPDDLKARIRENARHVYLEPLPIPKDAKLRLGRQLENMNFSCRDWRQSAGPEILLPQTHTILNWIAASGWELQSTSCRKETEVYVFRKEKHDAPPAKRARLG